MSERGSYPKGVQKREELLATALEVIAENGYGRASIKDLAAAVGLSQAGLQHHFGSKSDLLLAVLEARDAVDSIDRTRKYETDPLAGFVDGIVHNLEVSGLVQLYVRLSAEASDSEHPAHQYFFDRTQRVLRTLTDSIAHGQAQGKYRSDIPAERLGTLLLAVAEGLQAQWLINPQVKMGEAVQSMVDLFTIDHPAPTEG